MLIDEDALIGVDCIVHLAGTNISDSRWTKKQKKEIYSSRVESAEFLYQKIRVPPEENTAIFFPASYTHTHRGNVVHGEKAKYVITGWFYIS